MIALQTDEGVLDFDGNASVAITATNPALDAGGQGRVFTLPFKLPNSPRNVALLKAANRLDHRTAYEDPGRPATLWLNWMPWKRGVLEIQRHDVPTTEAAFINETLDFWKELGKVKIRTVLETVSIPQTLQGQIEIELNDAFVDFALTINDESFAGSAGTTDLAGIALEEDINATVPGMASYGSSSNTLVLYAGTLDRLDVDIPPGMESRMTVAFFRSIGLSREENLRAHLDDLVATPVASHSFPVISAPLAYGDKNPIFSTYLNGYAAGAYTPNTLDPVRQHVSAYAPQVRLAYVLRKAGLKAGVAAWSGPVWEADDFQQISIQNVITLDLYQRDYDTDADEYKEINCGPTQYDLNQYVPDWTGEQLLRAVLDGLNLYVDVVGNTAVLRKKISQLQSPAVDISERVTIEPSRTVVERKTYYLRFIDDANEQNAADITTQLQPYGDLTGEVYQLPFKPLYEFMLPFGSGDRRRVCQWRGLVTSTPFGLSGKCEFRLFFDRGLQPSRLGDDYLQSATGNLSGGEDVATAGEWALYLEGTPGLVNTFHQNWQRLDFNSTVQVEALMTIGQLAELSRWLEPVVRFYHPLGEVEGIVKDFNVTANQRGLSLTRLNIIKKV